MAVLLEANYSKKLGLPQYSSHSFSVSVKTELNNLNDVQAESEKLYRLLQESVDAEIQHAGYLPNPEMETIVYKNGNGNGSNGHQQNGHNRLWKCSDKQRDLILKVVEDNQLDEQEVDELAYQLFNKPVRELNKMQSSNLIDELLSRYGNRRNGNGRRSYAGRRS